MAAFEPAARKLQREMQIGDSARLLGRAASGHSSMGLKSIYPSPPLPTPLSFGYVFFFSPPTIQEDGKKTLMFGAQADTAGTKKRKRQRYRFFPMPMSVPILLCFLAEKHNEPA